MLTTDQKGAIAETAMVHEATKLGIRVYKPVMEGSRCDFILDVGGRLIRVQCKWTRLRGEVISVPCYSSRRARHGLVRRCYTADEIDAFVAYCPELDRCYFLPIDDFSRHQQIHLRLAQPRNNQKLGINWARDYEFAARLAPSKGP